MTFRCLALALAALISMNQASQAEDVSIVSLVVSIGDAGPQADAFQETMRGFGAVTLRADNPKDSELRNQLYRFADEVKRADVGIVLLLAPSVANGQRDFIVPADTNLNRASDLLTRSVPVSAFARAADLAGEGGVVISIPLPAANELPQNVRPSSGTAERQEGMAPIVTVPATSAKQVLTVFQIAKDQETVEFPALLARIETLPGVKSTYNYDRTFWLRSPKEPVAAPEAVQLPAPVAESVAAAPPDAELDVYTLQAIERGVSRNVRRIAQEALNVGGYYQGPIDGVFGDLTRAAIMEWQKQEGAKVTGFLTPDQWQDLQ
ncbi:His-Xaa-Ser repeat protein HxsA [Hartmannibacter diazotrophicus]|uniref:His-Xaa-Ser repeat protein HxsA n=1 Tax=Hartmannibacter diazotrophicus TaxID=1482074 RepID=A0A2C9D2K6_9HYPH|nr:peptidoglycan-binding domain-containing protein [Hartmannibacter diazotrophicus]SON54419.1 His-Xaa-Ser repeat protein HxsA [Hartmannibacter diazotrophicus]